MKSGANANMEAATDVNVKSGANAYVKATGDANLKATGNVNVQGIQANVKGDAVASLGGAIVNVKGDGMVAIDGSIVSFQNSASSPPGTAGSAKSAGSATDAEEAAPDGDRKGPDAVAGQNEIEPNDSQTGGTILIPPLETKRFTQPPPEVTGSDQ